MQTVTPIRAPDERSRDLSEDKALASIERYMQNPPENSRVFTITPKMASYLLTRYNDRNRPPKPVKQAEYVADILAGDWKLTGDTIKFSRTRLCDGQNRLKACVEADKPILTHVVFGIDDDDFWWIDRGKPRSAADNFDVLGNVPDPTRATGILRWLEMIETDGVLKRTSYTPQALKKIFDRHDRDLLIRSVDMSKDIWSIDRSPNGPIGALYYQTQRLNKPMSDAFFAAWQTGQYGTKFHGLRQALEIIQEMRLRNAGRVHDVWQYFIVATAWNLAVAGKKGRAKDFQWQKGMPVPVLKGAGK